MSEKLQRTVKSIYILFIAETQKRRRFHPLRNLRKIFRRRTITSVNDTSAVSPAITAIGCGSEKNLRSATLSTISTKVVPSSVSSPSSPLSHEQLQESYIKSLPKSKSYLTAGLETTRSQDAKSSVKLLQTSLKNPTNTDCAEKRTLALVGTESQHNDMSTTAAQQGTSPYHQQRSSVQEIRQPNRSSLLSMGGVAVFPTALTRNALTERRTLCSIGDSSQDLNSTGNDSISIVAINSTSESRNSRLNGNTSSGEMSDSQRSLSEDRLVDSNYSREQVSRSHDSVFSESATVSSISLVKAELADVLRKRRQRPDASEEDLGLPRSPTSPQTRIKTKNTTGANNNSSFLLANQSERSSLSLLSVNSADDDFLLTSTANNSFNGSGAGSISISSTTTTSSRHARSITTTTISTTSINKSNDDVDFSLQTNSQKLSHSAAKHKMAVKPVKQRRLPTLQNRRTLEISIPEANEDNGGNTLSKRALTTEPIDSSLKVSADKDQKNNTQINTSSVNKTTKLISESAVVSKTTSSTHTATATGSRKTENASKLEQHSQLMPKIKTSNLKDLTVDETKQQAATAEAANTSISNSLFGLRALTARATTALFDHNVITTSKEQVQQKSTSVSNVKVADSSDAGFLRRIVTRNSKRKTIDAKPEEEQQLDGSVSTAKKLHVSNSDMCIVNSTNAVLTDESNNLEKCRSAISHEQCIEEKRKEIKKEIMSEGAVGLNAMFNSFLPTTVSKSQQIKPKSGPAARQRVQPQEIDIASIDRTDTICSPSTKHLNMSPVLQQEVFAGTSTICDIIPLRLTNRQQQQQKLEQHFEKKSKMVGINAYQQKISRSHDTMNYSSHGESNNSLETMLANTVGANSLNYDCTQKKRNSVEKSRSFRTYNENRDEIEKTNNKELLANNMPSLPDLTLSLRVPLYSEHDTKANNSLGFEINDNNLLSSPQQKSGISNMPSVGAVLLPELTNSKRCNQDIREIEQNIDKIVQSTVINVLGNGNVATAALASSNAKSLSATIANEDVNAEAMEQDRNLSDYEHVPRPKTLPLKELKISVPLSSPNSSSNTVKVPLRNKSERAKVEIAATNGCKILERKSAPNTESIKINLYKTARRSSSVVESSTDPPETDVPEFMKIQLNRVNASSNKGNIVLAKNVKLTKEPKQPETTVLDLRHCSNESLDINDKEATVVVVDTKPKQSPKTSVTKTQLLPDNNCALPPKAPLSAKRNSLTTATATATTTATTASAAVITNGKVTDKAPLVEAKPSNSTEKKAAISKVTSQRTDNSNQLSLQERRRLFMQDQLLSKSDSKSEELRPMERKKSLPKETTVSIKETAGKTELTTTPTSGEKTTVVLRKKSLVSNGNISLTNNNSNKDDATPELMKVFARRSLKIRDEDLPTLSDKIMANSWHNHNNNNNNNSCINISTTIQQQQNIDSDKENQSISDEQLDKLLKNDASSMDHVNGVTKVVIQSNPQRSSLTDLHNGVTAIKSNNNNNNNGNNSYGKIHATANSNKLHANRLSVDTVVIEHNNHNNNKSLLERQSLNEKNSTDSNSSMSSMNSMRSIERSATVGEFKGIHQRRAEWEQRAKEAFK